VGERNYGHFFVLILSLLAFVALLGSAVALRIHGLAAGQENEVATFFGLVLVSAQD